MVNQYTSVSKKVYLKKSQTLNSKRAKCDDCSFNFELAVYQHIPILRGGLLYMILLCWDGGKCENYELMRDQIQYCIFIRKTHKYIVSYHEYIVSYLYFFPDDGSKM
jgi:hypothetical protein